MPFVHDGHVVQPLIGRVALALLQLYVEAERRSDTRVRYEYSRQGYLGGACFSSKGSDEDAVWKGKYKGADMGVWGNVDVSGEVQQ